MKSKNLITISGRKGHGKDVVATIIQYLSMENSNDIVDYDELVETIEFTPINNSPKYKVKKFADKLKDIVCLLIGCTRSDLESQLFKETPLGEEWRVCKVRSKSDDKNFIFPEIFSSEEEAEKTYGTRNILDDLLDVDEIEDLFETYSYILTPRDLLQLIGTDCLRNMIHPNIHINSLFAEYKSEEVISKNAPPSWSCEDFPNWESDWITQEYPNWLITDTRFPNELQAVDKRGGYKIKIIRYKTFLEWFSELKHIFEVVDSEWLNNEYGTLKLRTQEQFYSILLELIEDKCYVCEGFGKCVSKIKIKNNEKWENWQKAFNHVSETALVNYTDWDFIIHNDGNLKDLIQKVKNIYEQITNDNTRQK